MVLEFAGCLNTTVFGVFFVTSAVNALGACGQFNGYALCFACAQVRCMPYKARGGTGFSSLGSALPQSNGYLREYTERYFLNGGAITKFRETERS